MTVRRRLRLGMVGGGEGAFIGAVHRMAARLDDGWELVAGAFQSDPVRSRSSVKRWDWQMTDVIVISRAWRWRKRSGQIA